MCIICVDICFLFFPPCVVTECVCSICLCVVFVLTYYKIAGSTCVSLVYVFVLSICESKLSVFIRDMYVSSSYLCMSVTAYYNCVWLHVVSLSVCGNFMCECV